MTQPGGSVTPAQHAILEKLRLWDKPMTASELREALYARSRAGITTALRNLVARGLVRETDPGRGNHYRERFYEVIR